VQDRQDGAILDGVEKVDRLPTAFERTRLRLAVADHTGDDQIGVVERGAEGVHDRVSQFAAFVHRVADVRNKSRMPFSSRVISG
jgi:hypothetical protein